MTAGGAAAAARRAARSARRRGGSSRTGRTSRLAGRVDELVDAAVVGPGVDDAVSRTWTPWSSRGRRRRAAGCGCIPSRRADAQDMFLAGQEARVTAVLVDVDGGDPRRRHAGRRPGRRAARLVRPLPVLRPGRARTAPPATGPHPTGERRPRHEGDRNAHHGCSCGWRWSGAVVVGIRSMPDIKRYLADPPDVTADRERRSRHDRRTRGPPEEEPQSERGAPGSRDTGSDEPGGGPVDRPAGTRRRGHATRRWTRRAPSTPARRTCRPATRPARRGRGREEHDDHVTRGTGPPTSRARPSRRTRAAGRPRTSTGDRARARRDGVEGRRGRPARSEDDEPKAPRTRTVGPAGRRGRLAPPTSTPSS